MLAVESKLQSAAAFGLHRTCAQHHAGQVDLFKLILVRRVGLKKTAGTIKHADMVQSCEGL